MNVYVLRHGRTKMNMEKLYNGNIDEDLIEEGIEGARKARKIVSKMNLDAIICSPFLRAKHTCEIINTNNVPVLYDDRLKERTLGELDGKNPKESGLPIEVFYDYNYEPNIKGYENWKELFKRVHEFLDELKKKQYENVLLVTHGGVLRAIRYYYEEVPEDGNLYSKYKSSTNCQIEKFEL